MIASDHLSEQDGSGVDLAFLLRKIWERRYLVGLTTLAVGAAAAALALSIDPVYRAETVLTEVRDQKMGGASSLSGQLGGLASLAGVNLAAGDSTRETQAFLRSRRVVEEFIQRKDLLPVLFPKSNAKVPPTLWRAVLKFQGALTIREDTRRGTTTVAIEWTDAAVAAQWANEIVALVNELLRKRAIDESERNIAFLNQQIEQTHVLELQRVMYNLIETETKTLMLANARAEYALAVVDPAVPPEIRISPKRTLMVLFGLALGGFIGIGAAFAHDSLRRRRRLADDGGKTLS